MNIVEEIAEPSRRRLLQALLDGPRSVSELIDTTGLRQANVSNHLAKLRSVGVVKTMKIGRQVYYSIANGTVESSLKLSLQENLFRESPSVSSRVLEHLDLMFDYDLWANTIWIEDLNSRTSTDAEWDQMAHILGAELIWIERIEGFSPLEFELPEPTVESAKTLHERWKDVIANCDLTEIIDYRRLNGEAQSLTLYQIASHVSNHGTYHRGVLRGIALGQGRSDFKDTDLAGYFLTKSTP